MVDNLIVNNAFILISLANKIQINKNSDSTHMKMNYSISDFFMRELC